MLEKTLASQTPLRPDEEDIAEDLQITPTNQLTSDSNSPIVNSHDNSEPGGPETQNFDRNITSQQHPEQDPNRSDRKRMRGERGPTLGHELNAINKREGSKLKIDFVPGLWRPINYVQATKLSSEVGVHVRTHMPLKTKWKDYNLKENEHIIPEAAMKVKVSHQIKSFFQLCHSTSF